MAMKTATVTARIQPEIKQQAETILESLGIPVAVLIDTLYRQIIMTGGIPYSLTVRQLPALDGMNENQLDSMLQKGYNEAKAGLGVSVDEAFAQIRKEI